MILEALLNLGLLFLVVLLGIYILFRGHRVLWATLGILSLWVTANLLAVFVADVANGRELLATENWMLVGIAFAVGVVGLILGRYWPSLAMGLIGFIAGADIVLWLYKIIVYIFTDLANLSEQTALIISMVLVIIGGLLGLQFVRQTRYEGLILITMIIGVELIQDSLRFNPESSWTAIVILSLALAGVLVQYADYTRFIKASGPQTVPVMPESSFTQIQNLELDS